MANAQQAYRLDTFPMYEPGRARSSQSDMRVVRGGANAQPSVNILVAYDWNGKYKGTIDVPLSMESESMFYAAGEYYVNFYSSGAQLYKISPVITYIPTAK